MVIVSLCFLVYFLSLTLFCFVSHPVYYCGLLVFNSLISSLICYIVFGFGWYSLLFCLVYIGGVYILFIFVSVFNPNNMFVVTYFNFFYNNVGIIITILVVVSSFIIYSVLNYEFSSFLCTSFEGNFYICMCLTLIFGFVILSLVMSVKFNHYR